MAPSAHSSMRLPGLDASVEIRRDRFGIAHIRANSVEDAFFGQGFVHAEDRLWQMERDRRLAQGRWAEVAGPAAVAGDRLARRLRLGFVARRDHDALGERARTMLSAYARGVNAYIAACGADLPASFGRNGVTPEPWQPWHAIAVFLQRHLNMGGWEGKVWRAHLLAAHGPEAVARWYAALGLPETLILRPGDHHAPPVASDEAAAGLLAMVRSAGLSGDDASNNWAVAGSRTRSGLPLIAGDPHRAVEVPNVYYQNHLACPDFDAIGISMPGVPGMPHFGHNQDVAWCLTHGMADTGDFFLETPASMPVVHRAAETIAVRGADAVSVDVVWTERGAVIGDAPDGRHVLSLRLPELVDVNTGFEVLAPMLSARSVAELGEAMRPWVSPCQNLVMGDKAGHIGYRLRGRLPVRHPLNAYLPVPGADDRYRWRGIVPFEEMPHLDDPDTGWLVTANNRHATFDSAHYVGNQYAPPHRAERISQLLDGATGLTVEDMARIHADTVSLAAREALALLPRVAPGTQAGRQAHALLATWDGTMAADAAAPLVYNAWREAICARLLEGVNKVAGLDPVAQVGAVAMGAPLRSRVWALAAAGDTRLLPAGTSWDGVLSEALDAGVARLAATFPGDMASWRWGDLHRMPPGGSLGGDEGPFGFALPGDTDTVRVASFMADTNFSPITGASVARYAFDVADWDASGWVLPHGIGGEADHPHFADQVAPWREARLVPMPYSDAAIEAATTRRVLLEPEAKA